MNSQQKLWFEWPIILLMLWFVQALEMNILQLPFGLGSFESLSVIIAFIAFTRTWAGVAILSFVFAFMGSTCIGYSSYVYISAAVWSALIAKLIVSSFALEGRSSFVILTSWFAVANKILIWVLLSYIGASPAFPLFFANFVVQILVWAGLAYTLYPFLSFWDSYFEHSYEEESTSYRVGLLK